MKYIIFLCFAVIGTACSQKIETVKTDEGLHFGAMINGSDAISYDDLLVQLAGNEGPLDVKVEGKVEAVCQAKGCWMNIVSEKDFNQDPMMVKFKDYGFFMPKDIAGKKVIMQGQAFREETAVDELRHYAEDAGKSKEEIAAITQAKVELKFIADGVILLVEGGSN